MDSKTDRQEKYELIITADSVQSTDERFNLYPKVNGADDIRLRMNSGSTYEGNVKPRDNISIIKHGLRIPTDVSGYEEFAEKMKISEEEFVKIFAQS